MCTEKEEERETETRRLLLIDPGREIMEFDKAAFVDILRKLIGENR